jgi:ATP-dependent Zn protease
LIDRDINSIIDEEYQTALTILREKKPILIKGAKLLLEKEKIDGEDL